jgi:low affinity Fe/Cu permease
MIWWGVIVIWGAGALDGFSDFALGVAVGVTFGVVMQWNWTRRKTTPSDGAKEE